MKLVLVGAGGFGREVYDIVAALEAGDTPVSWSRFAGYVDDGPGDYPLLARRGIPFLGPVSTLARFGVDATYAIGIGVGHVRRKIVAALDAAGCVPVTLIHPLASVGGDCRIGPGSIMAAGSRLTTNITLGAHVDIHVNAAIGHDSVLDDYASVYPGATVSGNVHLGEGAIIGTGANVLPGLTVGAGAVVGGGAVVTRDVAPGAVVAGVPAKPMPANTADNRQDGTEQDRHGQD